MMKNLPALRPMRSFSFPRNSVTCAINIQLQSYRLNNVSNLHTALHKEAFHLLLYLHAEVTLVYIFTINSKQSFLDLFNLQTVVEHVTEQDLNFIIIIMQAA